MHMDIKVELTISPCLSAVPSCFASASASSLSLSAQTSVPTPGSTPTGTVGTGPKGQSYLGLVYPKIAEPLIPLS